MIGRSQKKPGDLLNWSNALDALFRGMEHGPAVAGETRKPFALRRLLGVAPADSRAVIAAPGASITSRPALMDGFRLCWL
jgi:hypothetical protein